MFFFTLVQLIKIHKKINKVVNKIKKRDTPSMPILKFKFRKGIHSNLLTNWNEPTDLLKKTHKNNEITYKKHDTFKAIDFNSEWFDEGTSNKKKVPIKGDITIKTNKLVTLKKRKSNINTS